MQEVTEIKKFTKNFKHAKITRSTVYTCICTGIHYGPLTYDLLA